MPCPPHIGLANFQKLYRGKYDRSTARTVYLPRDHACLPAELKFAAVSTFKLPKRWLIIIPVTYVHM